MLVPDGQAFDLNNVSLTMWPSLVVLIKHTSCQNGDVTTLKQLHARLSHSLTKA